MRVGRAGYVRASARQRIERVQPPRKETADRIDVPYAEWIRDELQIARVVQGKHAIDVLMDCLVEEKPGGASTVRCLPVKLHQSQQFGTSALQRCVQQSASLDGDRPVVTDALTRVAKICVESAEDGGGKMVTGAREGFVDYKANKMLCPASSRVLSRELASFAGLRS